MIMLPTPSPPPTLSPLGEKMQQVSLKEWHDWKWQYRNRIHGVDQLFALQKQFLSLSGAYRRLVDSYPFSVTPYYLSLIDPSDENDPLARQCFPDLQELDRSQEVTADPLEEEKKMPLPGLVHRYPDRCLILLTNCCATYCRHCNRRRRWRKRAIAATREEVKAMIEYISRRPSLREVIISGGDPLTLSEGFLDWCLGALRAVPHVEVIRIGSRIPVVMPMRITKRLCRILHRHRPLWFMTQFNHPREITEDAARACSMVLEAGVPLANQSVLLKGVNDEYETLRDLFYGLQRLGVKPYYLFQCDRVEGTGHFFVAVEKGSAIMEKLRKNISGICLPRYVLDMPGEGGKVCLEVTAR